MSDKQTNRVASKDNDSKKVLKSFNGIKELKKLPVDQSSSFMCDIETGICGPVTQKEEGKQ